MQSTLSTPTIDTAPSVATQRPFKGFLSTTLATENRTDAISSRLTQRTNASIDSSDSNNKNTPNVTFHEVGAHSVTPSPNLRTEASTQSQFHEIFTSNGRTTISENLESEALRTHLISDTTSAVTERSYVTSTLSGGGVVSHSSHEPVHSSNTSLGVSATEDSLPLLSTSVFSVLETNATNDIASTTSPDSSLFETSQQPASKSHGTSLEQSTVQNDGHTTYESTSLPDLVTSNRPSIDTIDVSPREFEETTQIGGTDILEVTDAITNKPDFHQRATSVSDSSPSGLNSTDAQDMTTATTDSIRTTETPSDVSPLDVSSSPVDPTTVLPTDLMEQSYNSTSLSNETEEAATVFDFTTVETALPNDGQTSNATSDNTLPTSAGSSSRANATDVASVVVTDDWLTETELVEVTTYIVAEGTASVPVELWSSDMSSGEGTDSIPTEDGSVSPYDPFLGTEPTTTAEGTGGLTKDRLT